MTSSFHAHCQVLRDAEFAIVSRLHMRIVFTVLFATTVLTGCRSGGTSSVTPFPGAFQSPTPQVVLRLADAYMASQVGKQKEDRDYVREDYCRSFFSGFTMPGATMSGGTDASQRGFIEGQEYRRANPAKIKETMEGFGYTAVEVAGVWTVFFEHSGFCPDTQPEQKWWFSYLGDTQSDLPKSEKIPDKGVHIRVRGYLSPSGRFGHLGSYDHEIFASSISKIGG